MATQSSPSESLSGGHARTGRAAPKLALASPPRDPSASYTGQVAARAVGARAPSHEVRRWWRASLAPWLVVIVLGIATGYAGYYALERDRMLRGELADAQAAGAAAVQRAVVADERVMTLEAELSKLRGEFAAAKTRAERGAKAVDEQVSKLEALLRGHGELIRQPDGKLTLMIPDKALFRSGEAMLTERGMRMLGEVARALEALGDSDIWVQGHTDDTPIAQTNAEFASNWELSAARALAVVRHLQDEAGVDPGRLIAAAYGEHRPVSKRSKAENRRIEIALVPRKAEQAPE